MINLENTENIYVKGFLQNECDENYVDPAECKGNFVAVVTDLVVSGDINITSAVEKNGTWQITCVNGQILYLKQEPEICRELQRGKLLPNYGETFFNYENTISSDDIDKAIKAIENGDRSYKLTGFVNGYEIDTSSVKKLWIDDMGNKHAITVTGTHYKF